MQLKYKIKDFYDKTVALKACTARHTDGQIDRQTDRQIHRQTDIQTERQMDRQTDRHNMKTDGPVVVTSLSAASITLVLEWSNNSQSTFLLPIYLNLSFLFHLNK